MSIWLEAFINLNVDKLDGVRDPVKAVKDTFKKYGKDIDENYSEAKITRAGTRIIRVTICNPDCYVDCIHSTFKALVKQYPFISNIEIHRHYYS